MGRADAEAEAPIPWSSDLKSWLIEKDPDAGKDWGQEKWVTEDEMVGWHDWLNGHEFESAPGVGDGQGSLACYSLWGRKELDMTEQLNWTELNQKCGHKQSKAHIDYVRTQWRWLSVSQGKDPQMKPKLQHLISDFQPPELRENEFLLFKPHSPWSFVMAALAN